MSFLGSGLGVHFWTFEVFWTFGVFGHSGFIFGRSEFGHWGLLFWTFGIFGRSGFLDVLGSGFNFGCLFFWTFWVRPPTRTSKPRTSENPKRPKTYFWAFRVRPRTYKNPKVQIWTFGVQPRTSETPNLEPQTSKPRTSKTRMFVSLVGANNLCLVSANLFQ